ncbi:HNH endonuclease signature motif containing protein [Streptomyces sp. NPDC046161]|uniref:HNH endonuclease n=1 Tax=Streptomyces sp. NPDC046161 TaxID=3155132 RepID=UPI0033E28468
MPTSPPTRCGDPECQELTTQGRCEAHQRRAWANRPSKMERYGLSSGAWRKLKRRVAARDYGCCYRCGADQADVAQDDSEAEPFVLDHKTPIFEGGSPRDMDNLGLLCPPCDAAKSRAESLRANEARYRNR